MKTENVLQFGRGEFSDDIQEEQFLKKMETGNVTVY